MTIYDRCFEIVIGHEGGFTDDPNDRGCWDTGIIGKGNLKGTKFGIAAHAYPYLDIKNITLDDAKKIYRRDYWNRIGADNLPDPLALAAFDTAVNSGVGKAYELLQAAQGSYRRLLDLRLQYLKSLKTWPRYGNGWGRRIALLSEQCAALERNPITPPVQAAPASGGVLLVPKGGGEPVAWDGKPALYGGIRLDDALVSQLRIRFAVPGGPFDYGTAPNRWKVVLRKNGDFVLERA